MLARQPGRRTDTQGLVVFLIDHYVMFLFFFFFLPGYVLFHKVDRQTTRGEGQEHRNISTPIVSLSSLSSLSSPAGELSLWVLFKIHLYPIYGVNVCAISLGISMWLRLRWYPFRFPFLVGRMVWLNIFVVYKDILRIFIASHQFFFSSKEKGNFC